MFEYQEKFIVINNKHLTEISKTAVGRRVVERFADVLSELEELLPNHRYLVCNQDEPYADAVLSVIASGENAKEEIVALEKKVSAVLSVLEKHRRAVAEPYLTPGGTKEIARELFSDTERVLTD